MAQTDEDALESLVAAGFEQERCVSALAACGGDVEAALERLLLDAAGEDDEEDDDGEELPEEVERASMQLFTRPGYLQAARSAQHAVSGKPLDELVGMGMGEEAAALLKDGEEDLAAAAAAVRAADGLVRESSSAAPDGSATLGTESSQASEQTREPADAAPEPAPEPAPEAAAPSADDGSTASAESPRGAESARIERTGSITAEVSASRAKFLGPLSQFARLWCWFVPRIVLTPPTVDDSYALAAAARRVCCPRVQQRGEQGRVGPTPRGLRA